MDYNTELELMKSDEISKEEVRKEIIKFLEENADLNPITIMYLNELIEKLDIENS